MSAHTDRPRAKQRIPLEIFDGDILLLLRIKHKLEIEAGKAVKTNDIFRLALRDLAIKHDIIIVAD